MKRLGKRTWAVRVSQVLLVTMTFFVKAAPAEEALNAVMLNPRGHIDDNAAVFDAVRTALGDLNVGVTLAEEDFDLKSFESAAMKVRTQSDAFIIFSLLQTETGLQLCLFFSKAGHFGKLNREIEMNTPLGIAEAAAVILKSWTEALIAESNVQPALESPPEKATAERPEGTRPSSNSSPKPIVDAPPRAPKQASAFDRRLALSAGFDVWVFGAHPPAFGIPASLSVRPAADLHLFIGYEAVFHAETDIEVMRLDFKHHPVFLGGRYLFRWGRMGLLLSLALNIDYVISKATPTDSSITPYDIQNTEISVIPGLGLAASLSSRLSLFAEIGARIYFNRTRYSIAENYQMKSAYTSWPVQPSFTFGLQVTIF